MIHQSSARSTSSSSSICSCGSSKNAEATTLPNLILYGSPAPRSAHRTSLGAMRARPRQKLIKPTAPPPSTPDLHLDLGSLAESDSEDDCRVRRANLLRSNISVQQDEDHLKIQHSNLPSSGASSYHLSQRTNVRLPNKKSCKKINHKSKVSQILFHYDEFERNNKHNSDTEASYSLPFSKKNQHKQRLITKNNSSTKSRKVSSRTAAFDQVSVHDSQEVVCSQHKESTDSNLTGSTFHPTIERSNKVSVLSASSYKEQSYFNFSKELPCQTSASHPQSGLQEPDADEALICGINNKLKDVSFDSSAESYYEVTERSINQNNGGTSADNNVTGFTSKEERSFQLLNEEDRLLEEEYENMATSNCEIIASDTYSKGNTVSSNNYGLQSLNKQTDLCNFEKDQFSARENRNNSISVSKYDYDKVSDEVKEEEQTSSSSQGSLGRERKNSDASWSSYHSSTYTTLSDSTWGCSSDTFESFHSEGVCRRKHSFNKMDEFNSNTPRENPLNSPKSELNVNTVAEVVSRKQMNKDFEQRRLSSDDEWNVDHFEIDTRANIKPERRCPNIVVSSKEDEICPMKSPPSRNGADQTRQSSSSGITGSLTVDSSNDVHHSSPECPLQEFISREKENANEVSSFIQEACPEVGAVEEEEEDIISVATSEELCLLCSINLNACKCLPFPNTSSHNNSSISGNNSDNEHTQNFTASSNSFPRFVRNVCSAPGYNFEYERRTNLLMQRLECSTTAPDIFLSANEVIEAAMYARQLVHVLEKALDRALSFKTSVSEIASQGNLRRSKSVPEFFSVRSITNEDIPNTVEYGSLNTAHNSKNDKWRNSDTTSSKGQENAGAREDFTNNDLFSLHNQKQNDQNNMSKRISICQEKCYCCGPKLLNISPQELQQQKALLRPVDKKPQALTIMKDMASILKNAISQRRDIIVPPEDGAYYVSRSVSEWSIDE